MKTIKLAGCPTIVADDILAFDPNSGLKNFANSLSGSFTYPAGDKPCSILINNGVDVCSYACHSWLDFPETVIYRKKDGTFGCGKYKNTSAIPDRANVVWAVGGVGLIDKYNPLEEGFCKGVKNGKSFNYSDVLRKTAHTVLGIKDSKCHLMYFPLHSGADVNKTMCLEKFQMAVMLDGGHIAGINGSEPFAQINRSTRQGYALQGIDKIEKKK